MDNLLKAKIDLMLGHIERALDIARELNAPPDRIQAVRTAAGAIADPTVPQ